MRRIKIALVIAVAAALTIVVWTARRAGTLPREDNGPYNAVFPNDTPAHKFSAAPEPFDPPNDTPARKFSAAPEPFDPRPRVAPEERGRIANCIHLDN